MKAMCLADSGATAVLVEESVPQPQPGRGELLIQVHAAGVTSKELLWYPTTHKKSGERRSRAVPGHEFSGVVAAADKDTAGFDVGQEVYGMNDWFSDGGTAEYCITQPTSIAPKPTGLTHIEAASVPIGALTGVAGAFRSREAPGWRARTRARRSGCRGPLRDTASPISRCACSFYGVRAKPCIRIGFGCRAGFRLPSNAL